MQYSEALFTWLQFGGVALLAIGVVSLTMTERLAALDGIIEHFAPMTVDETASKRWVEISGIAFVVAGIALALIGHFAA